MDTVTYDVEGIKRVIVYAKTHLNNRPYSEVDEIITFLQTGKVTQGESGPGDKKEES